MSDAADEEPVTPVQPTVKVDRAQGRITVYTVSCSECGDLLGTMRDGLTALRMAATHGEESHESDVKYQIPADMRTGRDD